MFDMYKDKNGFVSDKDYKKEQDQTLNVFKTVQNHYNNMIYNGIDSRIAMGWAFNTLKHNKYVNDMLLEFDNVPYYVENGVLTYDHKWCLTAPQWLKFINECLDDLMAN